MKAGTIATLDDVVNIYKGISKSDSEDLNHRYSLSKHLCEFLVSLINRDEHIMGNIARNIDNNTIQNRKEKLTEFIQKNETISPYADLPAAERNILNDILTFIEKGDMESLKRKISELAGMIQVRNDDLNRIRNINKWSVPLSAVGLVLTIIFGVLSWLKQ